MLSLIQPSFQLLCQPGHLQYQVRTGNVATFWSSVRIRHLISSHLISCHLTSFRLNWVRCAERTA